jgi:predicted DNA-binding antitoxin AbrB/MazE fold protein
MDREQDIPFVFENGVLRPEGPIDFPEGTRGIAHIREPADTTRPSKAKRHAVERLKQIGESGVFNSGGRKLSREEMHERH